MKKNITELMQRLPGKRTAQYPDGEPFVTALAHGSMSVELYAPVGVDLQTPHQQDELYFINAGRGEFVMADKRCSFAPGDVFFVPAGMEHRFENFTADFRTWVVFWGPAGGEK